MGAPAYSEEALKEAYIAGYLQARRELTIGSFSHSDPKLLAADAFGLWYPGYVRDSMEEAARELAIPHSTRADDSREAVYSEDREPRPFPRYVIVSSPLTPEDVQAVRSILYAEGEP